MRASWLLLGWLTTTSAVAADGDGDFDRDDVPDRDDRCPRHVGDLPDGCALRGALGILLGHDPEGFRVDAVVVGSPAEKAGLEAGDLLIAVDGVDVAGRAWAEVAHALRGAPGSRVRVAWRDGVGTAHEATLWRAPYGPAQLATLSWAPTTAVPSSPPPLQGIVGLVLRAEGERVVVDGVVPNLSAAFAGVVAGSTMLRLDGTVVDGLPLSGVRARLRGTPGTHVVLVWRDPEGRVHRARLVRAGLPQL